MTEEELRKKLFDLMFWYQTFPPNERPEHETEYLEKKAIIRKELAKIKIAKLEEEKGRQR